MPNLHKGYLPPPVIIFLAILSLFVAAIILFNAQLIRNVNKQQEQTRASTPAAQLNSSANANWKTYNWHSYQIKIPSEYEKKEQNGQLSFDDIFQKNVKEKTVGIYEQKAKYIDPCSQKPEGYSNAHCTIINGYRAMDWGSEIPPLPMGPLTFEYTITHNNTEYKIIFLGIEKPEKDQILSTFKFTN